MSLLGVKGLKLIHSGFMFNTLILTLTPKKLHNLQNRLGTCKTRTETMTRVHLELININRVAQNKNLTYSGVGFSVISLTITKLMLEIRLESMQQTEFRLKCFIITGSRWKMSPIVSPKKQLRSCHATCGNSKLNSSSWT